jgi:hypothetical protein
MGILAPPSQGIVCIFICRRIPSEIISQPEPKVVFEPSLLPSKWSILRECSLREHSGNIQGAFREHSGNIQGAFREHSGNIQGPFGDHSETCREHSGNIQGTFREHSETCREHAGNIQGTFSVS